jgi:hypothetical protein
MAHRLSLLLLILILHLIGWPERGPASLGPARNAVTAGRDM